MRTSPINGLHGGEYFRRHPFNITHLRQHSFSNNAKKEGKITPLHPSAITTGSPGWKESFCMYLKCYFDMSTLHGLQYLAEPNRPIHERLFWLITIILAATGLIWSMHSQIYSYKKNPILMTLNGKIMPVWDVPFPAVTFCSDNQVRPSLINITKLLEISKTGNMTDEEELKLQQARILCYDANSDPIKFNLYYNNTKAPITKQSLAFASKMCQKNVKKIFWRSKSLNNPCSWMQSNTMYAGICHTFNALPPLSLYTQPYLRSLVSSRAEILSEYPYRYTMNQSYWLPDTGFKNYSDDVLLRLNGGSFVNTAKFLLDFGNDDIQDACEPRSHGYFVTVHNPAELPSILHTLTYAVADERTVMHITPKLIHTDDDLKLWNPRDRGCFYNHERNLKFFTIYTSLNCDTECKANNTLALCKCNTIDQPHFSYVPICGSAQRDCVNRAKEISTSSYHDEVGLFNSCNCLPACNELSYEMEVTRQPRNWTYNTEKVYGLLSNETKPHSYLFITAAYKSQKVSSIMRVGIVSGTDFIANMGGLMGLFMGFSFISIFEMFYFSAIRWITNVWRKKKCLKKTEVIHNTQTRETQTPYSPNETNIFRNMHTIWQEPFINIDQNEDNVLFVKRNYFYK